MKMFVTRARENSSACKVVPICLPVYLSVYLFLLFTVLYWNAEILLHRLGLLLSLQVNGHEKPEKLHFFIIYKKGASFVWNK